MNELWVYIQSRVTVSAVIEVAIIAYIIYKILMWIRGTQAEQVVKGIIFILVLIPFCSWLGFTTLYYILTSMFTWAFIIFVVVFQPELRSALEQLGNNKMFDRYMRRSDKNQVLRHISQISRAVRDLAQAKIGALIVCELNTGLNDIVSTGIELNADISAEILENIFTPNRPLHDGAVIVNLWTGKIRAAGCLLPLTDNRTLSSELGTRHRSGIGISEQSDAITIIVSEETGIVSYAERGGLTRDLTMEDLELLLADHFTKDDDESDGDSNDKNKLIFWGKKHDKDE